MVAAENILVDEPARAQRVPSARAVREFLLVGGATPLLFVLSWLARRHLALDACDLAVGFTMFYAAYVINDPHFAVTYVLFYRDAFARAFGHAFPPALRARYVLAGVIVPLALAAWAAVAIATRSAPLLGLMIQLMFLTVGWHYVKQGFGVMLVLAARRGVRFGARERLALLAHGYAGWAYAWASPADPGTEVEEKGVVYSSIAHAPWLEHATFVVFLASTVVLAGVLVHKRVREGRLPLVTPLTAYLASIWVWSIYSSVDPLVVYVIPALHSVQYLYFVALLRGNEARDREGPPLFERSASVKLGLLALSALALGVVLFHVGPSVLDETLVPRQARFTNLGATPYFAALYTFVNVHHFFMDFVIWRRDNAETKYLFAR